MCMKFFSAPAAQQTLRLVSPDTSRCVSLPEKLGREQGAALRDFLDGDSVLAYGRPGSGRSTLAFAAACALAACATSRFRPNEASGSTPDLTVGF